MKNKNPSHLFEIYIVSEEEHKKRWIDRRQSYLKFKKQA